MARAIGGITKFRLKDVDYDAISITVNPFNTEKTETTSLSRVTGFMEKYVPPYADITVQSTSDEGGNVSVAELMRLRGRPGEDAIVETNNGMTWSLHQVFVKGQPNYDAESGEMTFTLVAKKAEQLYTPTA